MSKDAQFSIASIIGWLWLGFWSYVLQDMMRDDAWAGPNGNTMKYVGGGMVLLFFHFGWRLIKIYKEWLRPESRKPYTEDDRDGVLIIVFWLVWFFVIGLTAKWVPDTAHGHAILVVVILGISGVLMKFYRSLDDASMDRHRDAIRQSRKD